VHPYSSFSTSHQLATPQKAKSKNGKIWSFFAAKVQKNKPIDTKFGTLA